MLQELESDNLEQVIGENDYVVVQYSASWCGNCRIMKPKLKKFSEEFSNVKFLVVDAEKFPEYSKFDKHDKLPTFAAYKKGKMTNQVQTNTPDVLKSCLDEAASK